VWYAVFPGTWRTGFDKLRPTGKAMLSLLYKRIRNWVGFAESATGTEHNDVFEMRDGRRTRTNFSGGIQGGSATVRTSFRRLSNRRRFFGLSRPSPYPVNPPNCRARATRSVRIAQGCSDGGSDGGACVVITFKERPSRCLRMSDGARRPNTKLIEPVAYRPTHEE
jgi:hypothetical protein